jgi:8-oxo-dGTP pyrophosphatase MutT (NUDIX family)
MIKVYSSGKIIHLIDNKAFFKHLAGTLIVTVASEEEMRTFYKELIPNKEIKEIFFYNEDLAILLRYFKSMFRIIEAAGGLVINPKKEMLFILRNGKWDLPKGKLEKGESIETAAVREVEEECGISGLTIVKKIITSYHTYFIGEQAVLKPTYWFEMISSDTSVLVPQTEEGITEAKWISSNDLKMVRENTYESILDVIDSLVKE